MSQKKASKVLRVLIIGCGNIAGGFDENRNDANDRLTHAGAYAKDKRFALVACVEPDDRRRSSFMSYWSVSQGFRTINEVIDCKIYFDIISICSPTSFHAHDIEAALKLGPKLIFCEKPITTSLNESKWIVNICREKNVPLAINYSRRFDPDVLRLKSEIYSKKWGSLRCITGYYNKGLLNNGSHLLDLLLFLIGPLKLVKVGNHVKDFSEDDPSIPIWLMDSNQIPIFIACGNAEDYTLFEMELIFSQGVITMESGGLSWRNRLVQESDHFNGYRELSCSIYRQGLYKRSMEFALNNIYEALKLNAPLISSGDTALLSQQLCEEALRAAVVKF